jgi:hypothetical protein
VPHWDCGGNDIESLMVEWDDPLALERCAKRCQELPECIGFNFGHAGAERGDNEPCYMKRDWAPAPACGGASESWDFYNRATNDASCAAHATGASTAGGCADGSVEARFGDEVHGCDTSWIEQGLQEAEGACAEGWHVCLDADEAALNGLTAEQCSGAPAEATFYATYQSSGGNYDCTTSGQNDMWGCGRGAADFPLESGHPCGPLTQALGNSNLETAGAWSNLGVGGGTMELVSVRKMTPANGGVLCCFAGLDIDRRDLVSHLTFEQIKAGPRGDGTLQVRGSDGSNKCKASSLRDHHSTIVLANLYRTCDRSQSARPPRSLQVKAMTGPDAVTSGVAVQLDNGSLKLEDGASSHRR